MLEQENLIIREPNGRFRAAGLSADEIEQLGILRITLEAAAVRITVPELTNADHAALEGMLAEAVRLAEMGEWDGFEDAHQRFHSLLTREAGPMHTEQLGRLWEQETRYRRAFERVGDDEGRVAANMQEHRALLDAAEARDAEAAAWLLAQHHARAVREIGQHLDPDHSMQRLEVTLAIESGRQHTDLRAVPRPNPEKAE
ncbi:FCD domain-containing protein [Pseudonocardia kujensis]|nr:FCD domain-containing protein [Pseudonocardia kujensis]